MPSLGPSLVFWGVVAVGCGGSVTDRSATQQLGPTGAGGADASRLPPDASTKDASSDVATPSDVACPIRVSGTNLTEADCYACVDRRCVNIAIIGGGSALDTCIRFTQLNPSVYCEWYADGVPFDKQGAIAATCKSNPGRVICAGGI
jgi:hypothetical protein